MTESRAERFGEPKARDAVGTGGTGEASNARIIESGKRDRSESMFTCGMGERILRARFLGRVPYCEAWALQRALAEQRKAGEIDDTLLLLEHDPVVTLGRDGKTDSLKLDEAGYATRGIELVHSDRGGDATYHGPGQVIGYPIMDLRPDCKDIRKYVRRLEQAMIDTLAEYEIGAGRLSGEPGVWLDGPDGVPDRKIGALGARLSRWVTHHGVGLNVNTDLAAFDLIVPCGITDKGVTSIARELGRPVEMREVMRRLAVHLAKQFGRTLVFEAAARTTPAPSGEPSPEEQAVRQAAEQAAEPAEEHAQP